MVIEGYCVLYPVYLDIEGLLCSVSCICGYKRLLCSVSCICGYRRFIVFWILYMWLYKVYCVLYPVYEDIEGLLCSVSCTCGNRRFIVFCILYMWK